MPCFENVHTATKIGGIIGIIQSIFSIAINIWLLLLLYEHGSVFIPKTTESETSTSTNSPDPFSTSSSYLDLAVWIQGLLYSAGENIFAIKGMSIAVISLSAIWFISSVWVIVSNAKRVVAGIWTWIVVTSVIILSDIAFSAAIFALVIPELWDLPDENLYFDFLAGSLLLIFAFNRFTLIGLLINVIFIGFAVRRVRQIKEQDRKNIFRYPEIPPEKSIYPAPLKDYPSDDFNNYAYEEPSSDSEYGDLTPRLANDNFTYRQPTYEQRVDRHRPGRGPDSGPNYYHDLSPTKVLPTDSPIIPEKFREQRPIVRKKSVVQKWLNHESEQIPRNPAPDYQTSRIAEIPNRGGPYDERDQFPHENPNFRGANNLPRDQSPYEDMYPRRANNMPRDPSPYENAYPRGANNLPRKRGEPSSYPESQIPSSRMANIPNFSRDERSPRDSLPSKVMELGKRGEIALPGFKEYSGINRDQEPFNERMPQDRNRFREPTKYPFNDGEGPKRKFDTPPPIHHQPRRITDDHPRDREADFGNRPSGHSSAAQRPPEYLEMGPQGKDDTSKMVPYNKGGSSIPRARIEQMVNNSSRDPRLNNSSGENPARPNANYDSRGYEDSRKRDAYGSGLNSNFSFSRPSNGDGIVRGLPRQ